MILPPANKIFEHAVVGLGLDASAQTFANILRMSLTAPMKPGARH
jgi:hypothetical protein